jgi:uncharacterized protein YecT (DUF1311 family)
MALALIMQQPDCRDPQDQSSMNICADQDFSRADAELNRVYQRAIGAAREADTELERDDPRPKYEPTLRAAQRAWVAFRDAQCDYEGMQEARGGSMEPMVVSGCMEQMTRARIQQLTPTEAPQ